MKHTEKLLSITNLKKYFPLSREGLFSGKPRFVRANEDITLDIYSGETFGLVGESGSGKSTLGRTILQLHDQTAGSTLYFGRTLEDMVPRYVFTILKGAPKLLQGKWDEENDDFRTLAAIMGGLLAVPDRQQAAILLRKYYTCLSKGRDAQSIREQLTRLRRSYTQNPAFQKYEELRSNGIDLSRLTAKELRQLRRDIQIIFQDPYSSLNPRMTVGQLIGEGLVTHGFFKARDPKMRQYILEIMERCGLQGHMLHRYPHQFSGGQRQRISIARALAVTPKFIVCDECVSALDVSIQSQILNLLVELKQKERLTYLFISHDLSVVRYLSDRIGVMYLGSLVELGPAEEIFSDPRHPYTVALLSAIPTTDPAGKTGKRILLGGSIPSPADPPKGCKFHTRCYMAQEICTCQEPPKVEVSPGHWAVCHFAHTPRTEKECSADIPHGGLKNG